MVSKEAISHRQGGHHDAQKFNTTTRPRRSDNASVSPLNNVRSKSCAIEASLVDLIIAGVGAGVGVEGSGVAVGRVVGVTEGSGLGVAEGSGVAVGAATSGVAVGFRTTAVGVTETSITLANGSITSSSAAHPTLAPNRIAPTNTPIHLNILRLTSNQRSAIYLAQNAA
jgi:hypothetical protein